jgi:hypothetical protein
MRKIGDKGVKKKRKKSKKKVMSMLKGKVQTKEVLGSNIIMGENITVALEGGKVNLMDVEDTVIRLSDQNDGHMDPVK